MPDINRKATLYDEPSGSNQASMKLPPNREEQPSDSGASTTNDTFQGSSDAFPTFLGNERNQHRENDVSSPKKRRAGDVVELQGHVEREEVRRRTKRARKFEGDSEHSSDESSVGSVDSEEQPHDVDPATVEGQLCLHPRMTEDQAKTAAKREYNRRNAARARLRSKEMVQDLQVKVSELTKFTGQLQRENELLRAQLEVLKSQTSNVPRKREPVHGDSPQQQDVTNPAPAPNATNFLSLIQNLQKPLVPGNILSMFGALPQSATGLGTANPNPTTAASSMATQKANTFSSAPQSSISMIQGSEEASPLQLLLNNNTSSLLALTHHSLLQPHPSLENNDAVQFAKKLADMMQTPSPLSAPPLAALNGMNNDLMPLMQQLMKVRGIDTNNASVSPKTGESQPTFQSLSPQTLYTIFRDQKGESGDQSQNPRQG